MNGFFDIFLRRPRLAVAIAAVLLISGVLSVSTLPMAFFPSVVRPAISVSCTYPGANASEVMNTVAGPIEDQVNGVEGFDRMMSSCSDSGKYGLTVYFQADYDRDLALMKVQAAVQQAMTQLPQEVKNTGVTVGIGQTISLGYVCCYSDRGELTREQVVDYFIGTVDPALKRVPGIGASGLQDNKIAMRVWLDSDRMAALGIGTDEVVAAVKAQNVQASLGQVGASPTEDAGCAVLVLIAKGRLHTPEEFGEIVVRTTPDGGLVYLRDIAKIELGYENFSHANLFGDKNACISHLYQIPGADTLATIARVKETLAEMEQRFPGDLKWDMTVDISRYSKNALRAAWGSFALAAAVALLLLLLCFRSSAAAVPLLAAVFALSLVFTVLAAGGYFLTIPSIYALGAALAFMVGVFAAETSAAAEGRLASTRLSVLAAGGSVTAASLVLLLVGGVQGLILRQLAVVFAATGVATALVAVTVVPTLCGLFLFGRRAVPTPAAVPPVSGSGSFVACAVLAALALAALALSERMPRDLVPNEDLGVISIDIKTREKSSRPTVVDVARRVRERIASVCDIEKSFTVFGDAVFSPTGEHVAEMYCALRPWSERRESVFESVAKIRRAVSDIPEAEVTPLVLPTLPGVGSAAYVSPLVLDAADSDPVRLANEAHRLQDILRRQPFADSVTCGYNTDAPHLRLKVDRAKCELLNVPLSSLFAVLQHSLGSIYVNDINLGTQVNRVTLMNDWKGRSSPEAMAGLYVRSKTGAMVPVSTLVEYEEELGPTTIYRYNRYIYCTVDVMQKPGISLEDTMKGISDVFARELPRDFATGWTGIAYEETSNRGQGGLMVALSVLAAFLVVLVRFESLRKALAVFLPTVAAVFGAVFALYATGVPLSLYSRFALVMLAVVNASFALFAGPEASGRRRAALPLLAAAMALPFLFATGAGAAGSCSFGVTLVGGYFFQALADVTVGRMLGGWGRRTSTCPSPS